MSREPSSHYADKHRAGRAALKTLLAPVQPWLRAGQLLAACSGIAAIWPYVVLNRLGALLLPAATGAPIDAGAVRAEVFVLLSAFGVQLGFYMAALLVTHVADLRLRDALQTRILHRLAHAPLGWFSQHASGQVRNAIQGDTHTLHTLVAHKPVDVTAAVVTPLALMVYAFWLNPWLGALTVATVPLYLAAQLWMTRGMGEKTAEMDVHLGRVSARGVEFVDGIEVVKSFGRTGQAHRAFAIAATAFADFYWGWCLPLIRGSAMAIALISVPVVTLVSLGGGALLLRAEMAALSQVLVCTLIALVIPLTLDVVTNTTWAYQIAGAAALRLMALTQVETVHAAEQEASPETAQAKAQTATDAGASMADAAAGAGAGAGAEAGAGAGVGVGAGAGVAAGADGAAAAARPASAAASARPAGAAAATVVFDHVSYAYGEDAGQKAVDDVSLTLEPGTVTALVGPSGSGKSTLATLLARFQDPDSGRVLIGGQDIRSLPEETLYRTVAFVLQRAQILQTSIRENIRLGVPDATDEQIRTVAVQARIWDDIAALPRGLDSVVGQDTNLSGGQKQRIAIARALLKDAPILILDEATASTDPDCAAEIQRALNVLARGRTVLVIGHTAAAVKGADQICILENGVMTGRDTAEALAGHPYWRMLNHAGMPAPQDRQPEGGHHGRR